MNIKFIYLLYPSIYVYRLVSFIIRAPIYFIKYFFIGLHYTLKYVYNYIIKNLVLMPKIIFSILKYFFIGFFFILRAIFNIIKYITLFLYNILKRIILVIIRALKLFIKGLSIIFRSIARVLIAIGRFIKMVVIKLGSLLKKIFGGIIPAIRRSFIAIGRGIKEGLNKVKARFKDIPNKVKSLGGSFKKGVKRWYNNLAPIKYLKNKRDMERQVLLIDFLEHNAERSEKKVTYKFVAKDKEGKLINGYFDAFSKVDVHSFLLAEGLEVYSIKTSRLIQLMATFNSTKNYKIKLKDLTFILTQLSTYIKSGIPLVDSVKILSRQAKTGPKKKVFDSVIYELVMGTTFSEALEKQGPAFPRLLINMIKTAEMTGKLSEVLDNMAEYYDSVQKTRSQMLSAMLYPSMVLLLSGGVVVFVMMFVIPQFVDMFRSMETEIPLITRIVIDTSDFLKANFIYLLIGLVIIIIILRLLFKTVKAFRYVIQWLTMHIPIMGKIIIYNEVTMFAKTFGSLLTHNVFLTDSMEILTKITGNEIYKFLIFDTMSNLARGDKISDSFKDHWAFPDIAYEMLLTGERTGELGVMMNKVGDYYQEQHKLSIGQIKSFIEPLMIMFLAATVGTILLSIIIPMFSMYEQF